MMGKNGAIDSEENDRYMIGREACEQRRERESRHWSLAETGEEKGINNQRIYGFNKRLTAHRSHPN